MKRRTIITSVLVIVLCLGLISGSTFALFTSESSVNIAVTSGKVKLTATLDNPTLYSADATLTSGTLVDKIDPADTTGKLTGTFAGTYYYKQQDGTFANGGTATIGTNGTMTIAKMTPGDKVVTNLNIVNESNVAIKYRLKIIATATDSTKVGSDKILDVLKVRFEDKLYNGLKEFSSAWIAKDAATAIEEYESAIEIIFPLDAGNDYQNNSVNLAFTVEAVQGNAKTVDIVTAATTAIVQNSTAKLVVPTAPLAEDNTTTEVVLTNVGTNGQTVKLTVETVEYDTTNSPTTYNVLANDQAAVASVDLKLLVNDVAVTAFEEEGKSAKITTYVVKGLEDISIVYNGDPDKAFGSDDTTTSRVKTSADDVDDVGEYYYEASTGKLVFITNHFSEYVPATKDVLEAINTTTNTVYKSLRTAIDSAIAGNEILLLKDADLVSEYGITKSITINGAGHSVRASSATAGYKTSREGRVFDISDVSNLVVRFENLTIIGESTGVRGISLYNTSNIKLTLESCNVQANYYAINIASNNTQLEVNVNNNTVSTGYCAIQSWSPNATFNISNSTLIGLNNKTYDAAGWNNFSTIVINETATNNVWKISNCVIKASQTTGNRQTLISFRAPETTTLNINKCSFFVDDVEIQDIQTLMNNVTFTSNEAIDGLKLTLDGTLIELN